MSLKTLFLFTFLLMMGQEAKAEVGFNLQRLENSFVNQCFFHLETKPEKKFVTGGTVDSDLKDSPKKEAEIQNPENKQPALLSKKLCDTLIPQVSKDFEDMTMLAKNLQGIFNQFLVQSAVERTAFSNQIGDIKTKAQFEKALEGHLQKLAPMNNYTPCPEGKVPKEKKIKAKTLVRLDFNVDTSEHEYSIADGRHESLYNFATKNYYAYKCNLKDYDEIAKDSPDKEALKVTKNNYDCQYHADYSPGIEKVCDIPGVDVERVPSISISLATLPLKAAQYSYLQMVNRTLTHKFEGDSTTRNSKCKEKLDNFLYLNVPDFKEELEVIQSEKIIQGCIEKDQGKVCLEFTPEELKNKDRVSLEEILKANNLPLDLALGKGAYMLKKLEGICKTNRETLKLEIKRAVKGLEADPDLLEKNINKHPFAPSIGK